MVLRTFSAIDSEALTVASDSPHMTPGGTIINNSDTPDGTIFQFSGLHEDVNITLDDTSPNTEVFEDDNMGQHQIVDGRGIVPDGETVESESKIYVRELDEFGNETGPTITLTVFSKGGNTSDVWGFSTDTPLTDGARYVKTGGNNDGTTSYTEFQEVDGVPCFAAGTLIATADGERPVETLRPGDLVMTADHGLRPVLWAATSSVAVAESPRNQPIMISAGALGGGLPARDLIVSPQHRIAVLREGQQVFVPAKALIPLRGVRRMQGKRMVDYTHILLRPHAVIYAEGMATESFFPGPMALAALSPLNAAEVARRFLPDVALQSLARPVLRYQTALEWAAQARASGDMDLSIRLPAHPDMLDTA